MGEKPERYLAFVDYLGTAGLYKDAILNADLIIERRNELEHAIQILLQPFISAREIEIGVFSDTVLIAGRSLRQVIMSSSLLMRFVLKKSLNRADDRDFRLLRGGFAKGIELRTSYLKPSSQVHIIPFFDGSLVLGYELEGVRRGSRLFFADVIEADELEDLTKFEWNSKSGFGNAITGLREFLWPGYLYKDSPMELTELLLQSFAVWRSFQASRMTPEHYRSTVYHFDETIKCMMRSFVCLVGNSEADQAVEVWAKAILPSENDRKEDCDIRYLWGLWFQTLLVLCSTNLTAAHKAAIALTKSELSRRGYLDKFIAESEYPEYELLSAFFKSPTWC